MLLPLGITLTLLANGSRRTYSMSTETEQNGEIRIDRAKYDSITLYEVSEDELNTIEQGSPSSTYLNIAISLLSIFLALLITLLTVSITDIKIYTFFVIVTVVAFVGGIVLFILWLGTRTSTKTIFKRIRDRKSPDAVREVIISDKPEAQTPSNATEK